MMSDTTRRKLKAALLSVFTSGFLTALKLLVGLQSGSVGVLSESLHSGTDLLAGCIALFSVTTSDRPPDKEHPYGHGKLESLASLLEGGLILLGAFWVGREAWQHLLHPATLHPATTDALAVMALSTLSDFGASAYLKRTAQKTDSPVLAADALHLFSDALASATVLIALTLVRLTGWYRLDSLLGLAIVSWIILTAFKLWWEAFQLLMDTRLPEQEEAAIRRILEADSRVLGYHKLRTRKMGSRRDADVHVQIEDECSLVEAHALTEELEDRIRAALPSIHINIHIEPYHMEIAHQRSAHQQDEERALQQQYLRLEAETNRTKE
ncbi:cation diffusion facilitator family transporter [Chthonomonas calidirosea]|nr:cation diffusion facilitator family transporter [Chthonomonas calidirosea]